MKLYAAGQWYTIDWMLANETSLKTAAAHLKRHDAILAKIIAGAGLCTIRPHKNYYDALARIIIGQQLSVKAADAIEKKFLALFGTDAVPAPEHILKKDIETLRTAGLSRAKATYIRDLAQHVVDGEVRFDHLDGLSNEEVIAELTAVKGIGQWTAHMFLMFCMGRLDILPTGDLGIRTGVQKLYRLRTLPDAAKIEEIAKTHHWHPYESVAAWYVWHSLDNKPVEV